MGERQKCLFFALLLSLSEWGAILFFTWLALWPISPTNNHVISRDSGAFLYIGWRWKEGEIPYRDIWDHKPPGVYLIDRIGLTLTPDSLWGVWGLELASLGLAAGLGYWAMRKAFGRPAALLATLFWLYTFIFLNDGGNLTQEYALPWQFLALALFVYTEAAAQQRFSRLGSAFALGLTAGMTMMIRQNSVGLALLVAAWWLFKPEGSWKQRLALAGAFGAGVALIFVATGAYFAAHGALHDFWDQAYYFNRLYAGERTQRRRLLELLRGLNAFPRTGLFTLSLLGYALAGATLTQRARFPRLLSALASLAVVALPVELALVALPGRGRVPYFMSLLPLMAVLAGFSLGRLFSPTSIPSRWGRGAALVFLLGALLITHGLAYRERLQAGRRQTFAEDLLAYIQTHTTPEETILVFGAEPEINFLARRRSPTRFVYQYPLYRPLYADQDMLVSFYQDILEKRPKLLIVAVQSSGGKIPDRFGTNRDPQAQRLAEQVRALYHQVTVLNGWPVYEYVGGAP